MISRAASPEPARQAGWLRHACSLWTALWLLAAAAAFYLPALARTGGRWPVPLDDVYIYFGHARSVALGSPGAWIPGHGYSSGATSVLYPLLLAPAWAVGLRGSALGIGAAALAIACLFDLSNSLRGLSKQPMARWLAAPLVVAVPLLDWSWFSGMETALFGALLGRALAAGQRAIDAPAHLRKSRQLRVGVWLALLVLTRPESVALALPLGVAVAHAAGSLSAVATLARAWTPAAGSLGAQALVNRALTGEWAQAGAVRKLYWSNPYAEPAATVLEVLTNLVLLTYQAFWAALGGAGGVTALGAASLAALLSQSTRRLGVALAVGAVGTMLVVCTNSTARYQNLRYAAPVLAMLVCTAALGLDALARFRREAALAAVVVTSWAVWPHWPRQVEHFAQSSKNIAEQQIETARRLRALTPPPRRVLLNDAGAIPYLSELPAVDGLGLGGFRGLPFARASLHGLPAVVELIERLPEHDRPDVMALYPTWWGGVADVFGRPFDEVRIEENVICGHHTKVLYHADWSTLAPDDERIAGAVDELDVADLLGERDHDYRFPTPRGGWVIAAMLDHAGSPRWDAGRIIARGRHEAFTVARGVTEGAARIVMRTDAEGPGEDGPDVLVEIERGSQVIELYEARLAARVPTRWNEIAVDLATLRGGDRITVRAVGRDWRSFHGWLVRR